MEDKIVALCTECEQVYAARKNEDGIVVPTDDGNCSCGNETFEEAKTEILPD